MDRKRENLVEKCGRGKKTRGMETKEKGKEKMKETERKNEMEEERKKCRKGENKWERRGNLLKDRA